MKNFFNKFFPNTTQEGSSQSPQRQICFVPDHFFFSRSLPVPSDLSLKDVTSFAEMSLEPICPFSLDQLNWGFLYLKGENTLFIYAALKDRLSSEGITQIDSSFHAFPHFIALTHRKFPSDIISFLYHQNRLIAFFFDAGTSIPSRVESISCEENASTDKILAARESFISSLDCQNYSTEAGFWKILSCDLNNHDQIEFSLSHTLSIEEQPTLHLHSLKADNRFLWNADIRDRSFLDAEYNNRRTTNLLWKSVLLAGICACFLLGGMGIKFMTSFLLDARNRKIDVQGARTAVIENNDAISRKIQSIIDQEMRPFFLLRELNNLKTKNIYFISVLTDRAYKTSIEGMADNANSVNAYMQSLNSSKQFDKAAVSRVLSKAGKVNFSFSCNFKPKKFVPPQKVAVQETPKKGDNK